MADQNGADAPTSASAQGDDYVFRSFQEYRWDLDKDFLVSRPIQRLTSNHRAQEHPAC